MTQMQFAEEFKAEGNKFFSSGKYEEAIVMFSKAIDIDSSNHVLFSNRSAAFASLKDFTNALKDAEKTVELSPTWAKGYSRLGAALHGSGDLEGALQAYERGLKVDPQNSQLKQAANDLKSSMESSAKDPFKSILNDGIWAKIAANPKISSYLADPQFCSKLSTMIANPQSAMGMMNDQRIMMTLLTLMGMNLGNPDDFMGQSSEQNETNEPGNPKSRSRSPSPAKNRSDGTQSEKPSTEEINKEENGKKSEMQHEKDLGNAAYKSRDFEKALKHYESAWELSEEKEITVLTNQAAVYFEMNQFEKCIELCNKAIDLGREQRTDYKVIAKALGRIGNAYLKLDDLENAIKYYQKSLTEHRTADVLAKLRDTEKLMAERKKAAYHDPALADSARERGNEQFKKQMFAEAVKEYTEAIARNESDPRAYSNRAACYHKLGAIPEALKDCELALARDPMFVKAYLRKAAIQHFTKDYAKCLETCELASKADVDGKHANEIQTQVQKAYVSMQTAAQSGDPKAREELLRKAMQDPEVAQILQDPIMNQILAQMQTDPGAVREHLANPSVASKIRKLMNAGILSTR
jgi:stress-induced-phosphoprotein 1